MRTPAFAARLTTPEAVAIHSEFARPRAQQYGKPPPLVTMRASGNRALLRPRTGALRNCIHTAEAFSRIAVYFLWLALAGCVTAPKLAPINTSDAGWVVRQGQALWRNKVGAPEIAGEIILATNATGRAFIEFLKNPLPLVSAQVTPTQWQIEFVPEKREFSGRGSPPRQLTWLHLLRALQRMPVPEGLELIHTGEGAIRIENKASGEWITLFLAEP